MSDPADIPPIGFISYASGDRPKAAQLREALSPIDFFLDTDLEPGTKWRAEIPGTHERTLVTVALLSRNTEDAYYQQEELGRALTLHKNGLHLVIPVHIGRPADVYGLSPFNALHWLQSEDASRVAGAIRSRILRMTLPAVTVVSAGAVQRSLENPITAAALSCRFRPEYASYIRGRPPAYLQLHITDQDGAFGASLRLGGVSIGRTILIPAARPASQATVYATLRQMFAAASQQISDAILDHNRSTRTQARTPRDYFEQDLKLNLPADASSDLVPATDLFRTDWNRSRITVLMGKPGAGKTTTIARYVEWTSRRYELDPLIRWTRPGCLPKLFTYYNAASLRELLHDGPLATPDDQNLGEIVLGDVSSAPSFDRLAEGGGLTRWLYDSGVVTVVIDGLDEFASRAPAAIPTLMHTLARAAAAGANALIGCRTNYWLSRLNEHLAPDALVEIPDLDETTAARLLDGIPLPPEARSPTGEVADWLRQPILIRMIRESRASGTRLRSVTGRSSVYDLWAEALTEEADRLGLGTGFSDFCKSLALLFLRERTLELPLGTIVGVLEARLAQQGIQTQIDPEALDAIEVFERSLEPSPPNPAVTTSIPQGREALLGRGGLKFSHETFLEYFCTSRLIEEFDLLLGWLESGSTLEGAADLALAWAELDYFQSSVYGFFAENLEPNDTCRRLVKALAAVPPRALPNGVFRNLIEYIGLTSTPRLAPEAAAFLSDVVSNQELDTLIRYNAARALERVHPAAPQPYFEYVSDWGRDFQDHKARQITEATDAPWVVRGWLHDSVRTVRYVTFCPNEPTHAYDWDLQREISKRLVDALDAALLRRAPDRHLLLTNLSLALVRWCHPNDWDRLATIHRDGSRDASALAEPWLENIGVWIGTLGPPGVCD